MKQISQKNLRDAQWKQIYAYTGSGRTVTIGFTIYACDAIPGITITHERRRDRTKVVTTYKVFGKHTDSPNSAVRYYNAKAREQANIGRPPAGSPQSAGRPRGDAGL